MADLKTTYQDDVLDTSVNEKRKYNMIQNADGTVSFEDVTTYSQIGDIFGAADINATNAKINEVNSNFDNLKFTFGAPVEYGAIYPNKYTSDTTIFTAPSDGFVNISPIVTSGYGAFNIGDIYIPFNAQYNNGRINISSFIHKGENVSLVNMTNCSINGDIYCYFRPITIN